MPITGMCDTSIINLTLSAKKNFSAFSLRHDLDDALGDFMEDSADFLR
jgi:hypothetical protein